MTAVAAAMAYLILDVQTGAVIKAEWPEADRAVPIGSLVKPFVALAWAQAHGFNYPRVRCRGCWSGQAHGEVDITRAVALSCNRYFLALAGQLTPEQSEAAARRFGLPAPPDAAPETRVGLGGEWSAAPLAIVRAYVELAARAGEPGAGPLLEGMRLSARSGTGKGVGFDALVKTGTAACRHTRRAPGDGYAVVLYPRTRPRYAAIVQAHSRPGAEAAAEAGRLLRRQGYGK